MALGFYLLVLKHDLVSDTARARGMLFDDDTSQYPGDQGLPVVVAQEVAGTSATSVTTVRPFLLVLRNPSSKPFRAQGRPETPRAASVVDSECKFLWGGVGMDDVGCVFPTD
uniref:Uncharacterized protein n=1 Tax=Corethron hystrix TaxID=216773 RepID=A0A7S1FVM9_9STRA